MMMCHGFVLLQTRLAIIAAADAHMAFTLLLCIDVVQTDAAVLLQVGALQHIY